jgi:predicted CXXCH cytochrome family protein
LSRFLFLGLIAVCLLAGWTMYRRGEAVRADEGGVDPNAACAACHDEIYERYRKTPMANASGPAVDGVMAADFRHAASGIHYEVREQAGRLWMSYDRDEAARPLHGRQELRYFIGSGKRGRTYLFEQDGYWFEAPINWYAKRQLWDMTPNHLEDREMPSTLPVDPGCLHCHASGAVSSLMDARNHYAATPFAHGGIDCAQCHGDGAAHVASQGKVRLQDLDKLEPVRRDSVCLNCHLEGKVAVVREGRKVEDFAAGDDLFDYELFFVNKKEEGSGGRATSQWEALLESECKRKSGDRLTCTTCHDPHGSPQLEERVAFYRQKCLNCHNQAGFAANHHPENEDCASCHMARAGASDIAHEQVTDHFIRKRLPPPRTGSKATGELVAVGGVAASDRDFGLAYAQMAARGEKEAAGRALELLRHAEQESKGAGGDAELHAQLGFLEQISGHGNEAAAEYRRALAADGFNSLAAGNLALMEAQQHHEGEAVQMWSKVFEHDPVQLGAGLNLAVVACETGNRSAALSALERLLAFAPDNEKARILRTEIRTGKRACGAR